MNITVYLGASIGKTDAYSKAAEELGSWIAANGHRLIYGGSKIGLMGVLAQAVLDGGGEVIGIEPEFFIEQEVQYDEITQLIAVKDMTQRKKLMIEMGDAYIAFPGGTGTLEEISEVISIAKLGLDEKKKKCILYNLNGYYDSLNAMFDKMVEEEFLKPHERALILGAKNIEEIAQLLTQ